jgi:protein involved in polysaccharide export with SLBB domain
LASEPTPDTVVVPLSPDVVPKAGPVVSQSTNNSSVGRTEMLKPSDPTIQPDSVLWVSVTEDPSLNGRYVVNNSSAIDFGYVGLVFMQDMTVQQAEAVLKNVLEGRYLNHASVSVKIAKASYDSVGVMGNVEVPGEVKIGPGATITLNDALRRAGGLRGNRDSNRVKIIRGGLRSPFGPAAEGEVYSLVSAKGDLQIPSVFLRNNDLAYVFAAESPQLGGLGNKTTGTGKRVILLGEVPRRGVIEFAENEPCTLMYLLFKIGGLPRFAKADKIQIVRRGKDGREKTFVVNGERLMSEGSPQNDVVLESGDRVIVPVRKIAFF